MSEAEKDEEIRGDSGIRLPSAFRLSRRDRWIEVKEEISSLTPWTRGVRGKIRKIRDRTFAERTVRDDELREIYLSARPELREHLAAWIDHKNAGEHLWSAVLNDFAHWGQVLQYLTAHPKAGEMEGVLRAVIEKGDAETLLISLTKAEGGRVPLLLDKILEIGGAEALSTHVQAFGLLPHWREEKAALAKLLANPNPEMRLKIIRFLGGETASEEEMELAEERMAKWRESYLDSERLRSL